MASNKRSHWVNIRDSAIIGASATCVLAVGANVLGATSFKWSTLPIFLPGIVAGACVGASAAAGIAGKAIEKRIENKGAIASVKRIAAGLHEELDELSILDTEDYEQKRDA